MKQKLFKRTLAATVATAIVAATPLLMASPASAAPPALLGQAQVKTAGGAADLSAGDANDTWTLRLPNGTYPDGPDAGTAPDTLAGCTADGTSGGRAHTYIIPGAEDPSTNLVFNGNGSLVGQSVGTGGTGTFKNNLFTTGGTAARTIALNTGDAAIINIPNLNFNTQLDGQIPSGVYNIGIACIDLNAPIPATTTYAPTNYWNRVITVTYPGGDAAGAHISWIVGAASAKPTVAVAQGAAQRSIDVTVTPGASDPVDTTYTVTADTADAGAVDGSSSGASTTQTVTGLTAGALYSVTVVANNGVGPSPASDPATITVANLPAVTGLTFTNSGPGTTTGDLSWTAPAGAVPNSYTCGVSPAGPVVTCGAGTTGTVTGGVSGTPYTYTVTPQHAAAVGTANAASTNGSFESSEILIQELLVERPTGKLVLTQRCGVNGDLPIFPASAQAPAAPAVTGTVDTTGTAPYLGPNNTLGQDTANFGEYPYPVDDLTQVPNPEYPTYCGIQLGTAKFLTSGPGAGQFFFATGQISQVTVVDTRDTDEGWDIVGDVSDFVHTTNPSKTFDGSQLGWDPEENGVTPAYTDSSGNTYTQIVTAGDPVDPNSAAASGLSAGGKTLGKAVTLDDTAPSLSGGLGISNWDARLKLLIPVHVDAGTYRATLSLTVA